MIEAALQRQHGNLDLGVRFALGSVAFIITHCRDIESLRAKHGLGSAVHITPQPATSEWARRYYRARVPVGEEAAMVTRLAQHMNDFQYVEFDVITHPCPLQNTPGPPSCYVASSVTPASGPAGTSFTMTICCWPAGTRVTKTFTTPSGRTIVINDVAGSHETVPAGWGGSNTDETGVYTVFVRDDKIGSLVRFRIT